MKKSILLVAVLIALVSFCLVFASCDSGSSDSDDPAPVHVTGVKLNLTTLDIYVGESKKLEATVEPEDATNKTVSWSSNKPEFATVDAEGNVRAVAAGDAIITVTTNDGGKYAECTVTVNNPIKMKDINKKVGEQFDPLGSIEVFNDFDGIVSTSKTENWKFCFEGTENFTISSGKYAFNDIFTGTCYAVYSEGDFEIKSNVANVTVKL